MADLGEPVNRALRATILTVAGNRGVSRAVGRYGMRLGAGRFVAGETLDEADLRIDTYRASGAGGQHVNKTDSAVRITHVPTGIVVQCQNERSQAANKQTALRILKSRLAELEQEKREQELARERGAAQQADFGSQIRSYVLQPYQLVKDHRTGYETGNTQAVLDGDLDELIHEYLLAKAAGNAM